MTTTATPAPTRPGVATGAARGAVLGAVLGVPAGVALRIAGYPSDELYAWLTALAVAAVVVVLVAAAVAVVAPPRRSWATGLVLGALGVGALAPALVVLDILAHSA